MIRTVRLVQSAGKVRTERQKKAENTIFHMVSVRIVAQKNYSEQNGPVQNAEQKEQSCRKGHEKGIGIKYWNKLHLHIEKNTMREKNRDCV